MFSGKRTVGVVGVVLCVCMASVAWSVEVSYQLDFGTTSVVQAGWIGVSGANRLDNGTHVDLGGGVTAGVTGWLAAQARDRGAGTGGDPANDDLLRDFMESNVAVGTSWLEVRGLPAGSYAVTVYVGDPSFPSTNEYIMVNGVDVDMPEWPGAGGVFPDDWTATVQVAVAEGGTISLAESANGFGKISGMIITTGEPDTTAPAAVTDLAVTDTDTTTITLGWTAPADDLGAGPTVASYDVRYSTAPIDAANFDAATETAGEPAPALPGQAELFVVGGLSSETQYYFAIKSSDASGNVSALSNVPNATTEPPDTTAPAAIGDLAAGTVDSNQVTLTWTAPGDDDMTGTAAGYDIRYSTAAIVTDANFLAATVVPSPPAPAPGGSAESLDVAGLTAGTTYWFAIKTYDEAPNTSALSNVASATTLPPDLTPPAAISDLAIGPIGIHSVELTWTAPGDDGATGQADLYDVRYASAAITNDADFAAAIEATGEPAPQTAGSAQSFVVTGLTADTTYWFAVKASDEVPNTSALSNVLSATTQVGISFYVTNVTVFDVISTDVSYGKVWTGKVTYDISSQSAEVWAWLEVSLDDGATWQHNKAHAVGHVASIAPGNGLEIQWLMDTAASVDVLTDVQFRVRVNEDPAYYIQHNTASLDTVADSLEECPKPIPQDDPYTMLEMMINKVYHQHDLTDIGTYGYHLPDLVHQVSTGRGSQMLVGMGVSDRPPSTYPTFEHLKFKATYIKIGGMEFAIISKNSIRNLNGVVAAEKQAIEDTLGIPKEHIIINWCHVHYTDDGELGTTQTLAALTQAKTSAVPVEMAVLHLRTGPGYNYTRRGSSGGFTDGPIDDNLFAVLFRDYSGAPVGSWIRFTGHKVVHADNLMCREMESRWGGICAFLNGGAGTINAAPPSDGGNFDPVHMVDLIMAEVPSAQFKNVTKMGVASAWTSYYGVNTLIQCTRIGDTYLPVYFAENPNEQVLATAALLSYDKAIVVGYGNGRAGPGGGYYFWNRTTGIQRYDVYRMTQETVRAANILELVLDAALGDLDYDGDVDLADYAIFAAAMNGPGLAPGLSSADLDGDGDCDLEDMDVFAAAFTG